MSHRTEIPPALGAFALVTLAVLLPAIGFLLYVMFAGFFHSR